MTKVLYKQENYKLKLRNIYSFSHLQSFVKFNFKKLPQKYTLIFINIQGRQIPITNDSDWKYIIESQETFQREIIIQQYNEQRLIELKKKIQQQNKKYFFDVIYKDQKYSIDQYYIHNYQEFITFIKQNFKNLPQHWRIVKSINKQKKEIINDSFDYNKFLKSKNENVFIQQSQISQTTQLSQCYECKHYGVLYVCLICQNYFLCKQCYPKNSHPHQIWKIDTKDTSQQKKPVFKNVQCNQCLILPIKGIRYKCKVCNNYDLCEQCYAQKMHNHQFYQYKSLQQVPYEANYDNFQQTVHPKIQRNAMFEFVYQDQTHLIDSEQNFRFSYLQMTIGKLFKNYPSQRIISFVNRKGNSETLYPANWQKLRLRKFDGKFEIKQVNQQDLDKTRHFTIVCNECKTNPIYGFRYYCKICQNYNLCEKCEYKKLHKHPFYKIHNFIDKSPCDKKKYEYQSQQNVTQQTNNGLGPYVTFDFQCSSCQQNPIVGILYYCRLCQGYNLCQKCYGKTQHQHLHFIKFEYVGHAAKANIKHIRYNQNVNITYVQGDKQQTVEVLQKRVE